MRSKSRMVAVLASVCVCAAMIGTGFASWVILDTQTAETKGNVTAESVAGEGITLSVSPTAGANIVFGAPHDGMNASKAWLVESEANGEGNLVVDITVTVEGNVGSFTIGFSHEGAGLDSAVTAGLIVGYPTYTLGTATPTGSITDTSNITVVDGGDGTATLQFGAEKSAGYDFEESTTFHVIATFNWGTDFNGANPYNYFNDGTKTANGNAQGTADGLKNISDWQGKNAQIDGLDSANTWGDVARTVLTWLNTNLSNVTYTVTFTASQTK